MLKKRKVSSKIDTVTNQHFMFSKEDEMRVNVYYQTLDQFIAGLNLRFNQETLKMIECMGHLLKLETDSDDIFLFSSLFDLNAANLKTEIFLLK